MVSTARELISELHRSLAELRARLLQAAGVPGPGLTASDYRWLQVQTGLTPREAEVAFLLAQGHDNAAIAAALGISTHTARHHTQHVLKKLRVHSRAAVGARIGALPRIHRG